MKVVFLDGKEYYSEADLKKADPAFFFGCSRNRTMITKKKIPLEEYVFATQDKKTNQWKLSSEEYKPAKLLISRNWVENNVPSFQTEDSQNKLNSKYQMAPPILELEEEEKFRDKEGNVLEIEVRGEKHYKKCYFLVSDVSKVFNLPYLAKTITNSVNHSYEQNIHYTNFIRLTSINNGFQSNEKALFLTYIGMLKVLFSSRSGNAEAFQEWATEKLFTLQMGDQDQKDELASDLIGVSPKTIADVFRKNVDKTPCVYFFKIGKDEENLICKFGLTDDLPRRTKEHQKTYSKEMNWGSVELICFSIIDPKFLSDTETRVKGFLRPYCYPYENQNELVRIKKEDLKEIKIQYQMIQRSYLGCYTEMIEKIRKLEMDLILKEEKNQREIIELKLELKHQKEYLEQKSRADYLQKKAEIIKAQVRADLLEKDLEIERLKRTNLEYQVSHFQK